MTFAIVLVLVLVLSSVYLLHQWWTGELAAPTCTCAYLDGHADYCEINR